LTPSSTSDNEHEAPRYKVDIAPAARRSLDRLRGADLARLKVAVENLAKDPRPHGCRKLAAEKDFYRIRVGNYRVIYAVNDEDCIVIITKVARRTTTTYR
jgi:mRNA interferase RelE/StbE